MLCLLKIWVRRMWLLIAGGKDLFTKSAAHVSIQRSPFYTPLRSLWVASHNFNPILQAKSGEVQDGARGEGSAKWCHKKVRVRSPTTVLLQPENWRKFCSDKINFWTPPPFFGVYIYIYIYMYVYICKAVLRRAYCSCLTDQQSTN